jgi:acylphosphatase
MIALRCIVEGRVQGVGFRYFVYQQARRFSVNGWVRNLEDGSVEVQAEGDSESMNQFLDRVRAGPSFSYVSDMKIREIPVEGLEGFSIVR